MLLICVSCCRCSCPVLLLLMLLMLMTVTLTAGLCVLLLMLATLTLMADACVSRCQLGKIAMTDKQQSTSAQGGHNQDRLLYRTSFNIKPGYRLDANQVGGHSRGGLCWGVALAEGGEGGGSSAQAQAKGGGGRGGLLPGPRGGGALVPKQRVGGWGGLVHPGRWGEGMVLTNFSNCTRPGLAYCTTAPGY